MGCGLGDASNDGTCKHLHEPFPSTDRERQIERDRIEVCQRRPQYRPRLKRERMYTVSQRRSVRRWDQSAPRAHKQRVACRSS